MPAMKSKSPPQRHQYERLEARISPAQKALFKRAAELEGRTLTDFVVECTSRAARRVVEVNEAITLSARDRESFVKELLNPRPPGRALRSAARWYKKMAGQS